MHDKLIAVEADITTLALDAIVNAANNRSWAAAGRRHPPAAGRTLRVPHASRLRHWRARSRAAMSPGKNLHLSAGMADGSRA
jgi:hypothetical protein